MDADKNWKVLCEGVKAFAQRVSTVRYSLDAHLVHLAPTLYGTVLSFFTLSMLSLRISYALLCPFIGFSLLCSSTDSHKGQDGL